MTLDDAIYGSGVKYGEAIYGAHYEDIQSAFEIEKIDYEDIQTSTEIEVLGFKDCQASFEIGQHAAEDQQTEFEVELIAYEDLQTSFEAELIAYEDLQSSFELELIAYKDIQTSTEIEVLGFKDLQIMFEIEILSYKDLQTGAEIELIAYQDEQILFEVEKVDYEDIQTSTEIEILGFKSYQIEFEVEQTGFEDLQTLFDILLSGSKDEQISIEIERLVPGKFVDDFETYTLETAPTERWQVQSGTWEIGYIETYLLCHLNESGGASASDSSIYERNGTLVNMEDADWVSGKFGNCLDFNSDSSNEYVNFGNILNFERDKEVTYLFWINSTYSGSYSTIFSKVTPSGGYYGTQCFLHNGKITFYMTSASGQIYATESVTVNDGDWHLIAITYDGSSNSSGVYIYVDGIDRTSGRSGTVAASILNSGNFQISGRRGASNVFYGKIDEFAVYDYVKTTFDLLNPPTQSGTTKRLISQDVGLIVKNISKKKASIKSKVEFLESGSKAQLVGRYDGTNYYYAELDLDADTVKIVRKQGVSETTVATTSHTLALNTEYEVELKLDYQRQLLFINGSRILLGTDTAITAAGKFGYASASMIAFDDFELIESADLQTLFEIEIAGLKDQATEFETELIRYEDIQTSFEAELIAYEDLQSEFEVEKIGYKDEQVSFEIEIAGLKDTQTMFEAEIVAYQDIQSSFEAELIAYEDLQSSAEIELVAYLDQQTAFEADHLRYEDIQSSFECELIRYKDVQSEFDTILTTSTDLQCAFSIEREVNRLAASKIRYMNKNQFGRSAKVVTLRTITKSVSNMYGSADLDTYTDSQVRCCLMQDRDEKDPQEEGVLTDSFNRIWLPKTALDYDEWKDGTTVYRVYHRDMWFEIQSLEANMEGEIVIYFKGNLVRIGDEDYEPDN